ncbi:MAG: PQQ-binding-like beta-propeller repeat protein [Ignavibacterium sp.]|jgi:outer membrane protein assembly factor BamB|nr:PQQ-binding-like beta-propeller repeat protein [Ignavibacterium sp.]
MTRKFTVIVSIFIIIAGISVAQTNNSLLFSDWNNGGGNPQRNGLAYVDGPTTDSLLWQANPDGLFGMPVYIEGNKLVTMRFISQTNSPIVCYDLNDGTLLWEKEITGLTAKSLPIGVRDNQVYAIRSTDNPLGDSLYAFDLNTGTKIWTSDVTVNIYGNASTCFAPNGDLLIERYPKFSRINYQTGQLIWDCDAFGFVFGHLEMSVNSNINTGYFMEQQGGDAYVTAVDLTTGTKKYSHIINNTHPGGGLNQVPFIVGNNGIIYAHKQGDNITALQDNGTALNLLWETELFGNPAFSHICEGADGSIYAPNNDKIVRIEPSSGQIVDSSQSVFLTQYGIPVISATQNDMIYLTNGENELYAFDLDLNLIWSDDLPYNNTSGVAIGSNGLIAVAGANVIKVYTNGNPVFVEDEITLDEFILSQNYPNPFNPITKIKYQLPTDLYVSIKVYNILGKEVALLVNEFKPAGSYEVKFDANSLTSGIYFYRIDAGTFVQTRKMILLK